MNRRKNLTGEMTYDEIAQHLFDKGIADRVYHRDRIRQIEKVAINKIIDALADVFESVGLDVDKARRDWHIKPRGKRVA